MAKIEKYEDLRCWQQARKLVNQVYKIVDHLQDKKEFALLDQLKRAAISVMTNIAEGFARYHKKDFIRFLDYAQSSAQEVKSLLYIVLDQEMSEAKQIRKTQDHCDYCQAMILVLLKHVRGSITIGPDKVTESEVLYIAHEFIDNSVKGTNTSNDQPNGNT